MRVVFILLGCFFFLISCQAEERVELNNTNNITPINVTTNKTDNEDERYIVIFKKSKDTSLIRQKGGKVLRETKNLPIAISKMPEHAKKALEKNPNIQIIEKDKMVELNTEVTDWGIKKTKSSTAWETHYTGKGVKVAVLDTGIETQHNDLKITGGISFITEENGDTSYNDYNGHGTHVAGIISAQHNDIGVLGVAPDVELYSIKALDQNGAGYLSDVVAGIDWAITNNIDIINLSIGMSTYSQILADVIDYAYQSGMFIVAAAGNSGNSSGTGDNIDYPARLEGAIAVGATTLNNTRASFSSTGPALELTAPGDTILSSYINNNYEYLNGTSMAAPFVTGIAALLKQAYPEWTNDQLRSHMRETVIDLGEVGVDSKYGYGLIQFNLLPETEQQELIPLNLEKPLLESAKSTDESITIRWQPVQNANRYMIKREEQVIYLGSALQFTEDTLQPGQMYRYEISALNGQLISEELVVEIPTALRTPNLLYSEIDANTIELQWTLLQEAIHYTLRRNGVVIYSGTSTTYVDRELPYNSTVEYELVAQGTTGVSQPIKKIVTTKKFIPPVPLNLDGEVSDRTVSLKWTVPDTKNIEGYYIYMNGSKYNKQPIVTTMKDILNLTNGKTYTFTVTSISKDGVQSDPSEELVLIPKIPITFDDIGTHWARSDIQLTGNRGWMKGTSPGIFSPDKGLSRAEAAVIIVRALQLQPLNDKSIEFLDVDGKHWAKNEIKIIAQHDIMTGKSEGRFSPADTLTREQMAAMLHRMFLKDKPIPENVHFVDVHPRQWSYHAIATTSHYKLFYGYNDGTFKPNDVLTRSQMAVLMNRITPYFF
ncbi:S8 family serine peptidase [Bacillus sp. Marseille-P3661]|uniref:S8 family serine peptidase n=1 Tax=Bacillus sp. Marseille-P3661 TaxID=1936234 RepID=UPI000C85C5A5|nr:S8 family serine peptidase [Bacillus sp. Marseille-P3661]